jgi:hypothetical protein
LIPSFLNSFLPSLIPKLKWSIPSLKWSRSKTALRRRTMPWRLAGTEIILLTYYCWLTFCTEMSLLTDYFTLEYPYWLTFLYWNIPTDGLFCTGISLLANFFVLKYPYWRTILHWNIPTD